MGNPIRYIPPGGALVEVTTNFYQGRYLGRPDKHGRINETVLGVFGYAQRKYSVSVMALSMLSSHYHALCFVEDAKKLANFMRMVNCNLSKEIGLLHNWPGKMWTRRYRGILVSHEKDVQIARLKYVLAAGVKEFLVDRAADWPGVHSANALVKGEPLTGFWFNRYGELCITIVMWSSRLCGVGWREPHGHGWPGLRLHITR